MTTWLPVAGAAILGHAAFHIFLKLSSGKINGLTAALVIAVAGIAVLLPAMLIYKSSRPEVALLNVGLWGAVFAALAGVAIIGVDVAMYMLYERGAPMSLAVPVILVCSLSLATLFGLIALKEPLTITKTAGLLTAVISVYLLSRG